MLKNLIISVLFFTISSCIIPPGARINGKVIRTGDHNIFGSQHYKYRCKTADDCCEVGKNCEEDLKKKNLKND